MTSNVSSYSKNLTYWCQGHSRKKIPFKLLPERSSVVSFILTWIWFDCSFKEKEALQVFMIDSAMSSLTQCVNDTAVPDSALSMTFRSVATPSRVDSAVSNKRVIN